MKALVSFITCALVTLSAPAKGEVAITTYVDRLFPSNNGLIDVVFRDAPETCTFAGTPKRFRLQIGASGATAEGVKQIYAALLYASASEKKVTVYFDEATATCNIIRLYVYN